MSCVNSPWHWGCGSPCAESPAPASHSLRCPAAAEGATGGVSGSQVWEPQVPARFGINQQDCPAITILLDVRTGARWLGCSAGRLERLHGEHLWLNLSPD